MSFERASQRRRFDTATRGPLRRARRAIALLALVAPLACAGQQTVVVWEKPGAGPEELEAARRACLAELEAPEAPHAPGVNRSRLEAEATGACFVACMKRHGFTWRTEKVSTRGDDGGATAAPEGAAAQEPFDEPFPPTDGCSSTGDGRDGS